MNKLFTLVLLSISTVFYAQKNEMQRLKAQEQLDRYEEVYISFNVDQKSDINTLPRFIIIDHKTQEKKVYAYVTANHYRDLLALHIPFEVVSKGADSRSLTMANTTAEMANWDRYPTYSVYLQMMEDFAANYPDIARLETIATTQEGRLVQVLKITDNPDVDEDEPEFFYTGQMHGDELVGSVMLLRLIDYLLTNYGNISEVTDLVNDVEIWINPLANPDGLYHGGDNTVSGAMRVLSNFVDPNRNFPGIGDPHPDGEAYAPETQGMMDFANNHSFVLSANIHSGAVVVNYPWDTWESSTRKHVDDAWWKFVSHEYADTAQANSTGGYFTDFDNGITEGGDWYIVYGGRQDYMTYFKQGREFTLELSDDKMLDAELLPDYWNYNFHSLLLYIKQSLYGIRGVITDSVTGEPLEAKVEISGHDDDNSFVFSTENVGDYHRLILSGNYDVTYSKEGYDSQTINLNVTNFNTTIQDVALHPIGASVADSSMEKIFAIYPNPVNDNKLNLVATQRFNQAQLKVYNNLGSLILKHDFDAIQAGKHYKITFPENMQAGVYYVQILTQNTSFTKPVIKE